MINIINNFKNHRVSRKAFLNQIVIKGNEYKVLMLVANLDMTK